MKQGILDTETAIQIARIESGKKAVDETKKTEEEIDLTKDEYYIAEQKRLADLNKAELDSLNVIDSAKKANADMLLTEQELAIQKENESYKIKIDNAIKFGQDTEALEIEHLNNINNINLTAQEKLYAIEKEAAEKKAELDKQEIARAIEVKNKKLQLAADAFTAIGGLIESFNARDEATARKQFKVAKAFNLAAALTNTYLAVTSALATSKELFPGQRFIEAGIAGTTGLAQVAKIASTQFGGGGGGGGVDVPNPSSIIAPNLNVVGNTGINQLATLQQQPVKAYVVSNDITSAQQFDMKVQQTSQL
jgi:hypothetical protein